MNGIPTYNYVCEDIVTERLWMVQAVENGWVRRVELVSSPMEISRATLHRVIDSYREKGVEGLLEKKRGPKIRPVGQSRAKALRRWYRDGVSICEMARRLGSNDCSVRNCLRKLGLDPGREARKAQALLPLVAQEGTGTPANPASEAQPEGLSSTPEAIAPRTPQVDADETTMETPRSLDTDPMDRKVDRSLAAAGLISDAAPLFSAATDVPKAGALLALPAVVNSGVIEAAQEEYGDLGPSFYGLRNTLMALLFMALLRIKRPENLKEYSPPDLGRLLGLDRAPEVKTLRRKLTQMSSDGPRLDRFLTDLVRRRAATREEALGYLYVDGHVRVYHGKEDLPKTHIARMRISLPATQEVWVNDAEGAPLFFVTQVAHPQLVSVLPGILETVRGLVGDRRVTVAFDRGGWSPDLFEMMYKQGFDVLTYRKGRSEEVPRDAFAVHEVLRAAGVVKMLLHEQAVTVGKNKFQMRQVTRLSGDHQTQILTTRRDLPIIEVAMRMFDRWRQENFFKYMRQEYALDVLVEHGAEDGDAERTVPNPARKKIDAELRKIKAEVKKLEAALGAAAIDNEERQRRTMRGFKIAHGTKIGIPLRMAREQMDELKQKRKALPARVPIGTIKERVVRLPDRRKRLTDALKMLAYQAESDLCSLLGPHYARSRHEGRRFIASALSSSGDITPVGKELHVKLNRQSSAHRSVALSKLCKLLNETRTCFPGTELVLRYAVQGE